MADAPDLVEDVRLTLLETFEGVLEGVKVVDDVVDCEGVLRDVDIALLYG